MFVSHLSYFLFYLHVSASVQHKNRLARDKLSGDTHCAVVQPEKVVHALARYKTLSQPGRDGGNAPLLPHTRYCASCRRVRLIDKDPPPEQADIILGVMRECMSLKALLCSGNDASQ